MVLLPLHLLNHCYEVGPIRPIPTYWKRRLRLNGWPPCQPNPGFVLNEIWLLRLHALLARAHGDEAGYRDYWDRYRAMATSLGFEGHMKWAEAMP